MPTKKKSSGRKYSPGAGAKVKKVMEEHRGELILEDREGGGARVKLVFPSVRPREESERAAAESVGA